VRLFKKKRPARRQPQSVSRWTFEPLEPRVLLSADAVGGSIDGYDNDFAQHALQPSADELRSHLEFKLLHKLQDLDRVGFASSSIALSQPSQWDIPPVDLDAFQGLISSEPASRIELIIVDSATPDAEQLLEHLRADTSAQYQVHVLDGDRSGVAQVGELLQLYGQVDAVHLIGHGAAAAIQLGSDTLRNDNLEEFHAEISAWRESLAADADILFYGCDVAANDAGRDLLATIATWTGADVAGSDDKTGAEELAADWQLEFRTGEIDTVMPFAGAVTANWSHSLATIVVTSDGDAGLPFGVNSVASLITRDDITLRQAIQAVNYDFQFGNKTVHTIAFDLDGTDYTITLGSALPNVAAAVVIDGTTDPNYTDTPVVTLTGNPILLNLTGSNIEVRGLVLQDSGGDAVVIQGSRNVIAGNHIFGAASSGVYINGGTFNVIGGTAAEDRNVISGNGINGVYIGMGAQGNQVIGNYIGVSADGQSAYGNTSHGIRVAYLATPANAPTTVISGNVVSANGDGGIYLGTEAYHVDILNNWIGVAADKETPLGNEGNGITVKTGVNASPYPGFPGGTFVASDVLIQGNTIAHNDGIGVSVENDYTFDVKIVQNRIYANDGLGIDLAGDGVTPNDIGDVDNGVNSVNNFPVISAVSVVDGNLRIQGTLNNRDGVGAFEIHFYYSDTAHSSGHGDAKHYIGSVSVTPSPLQGNANFNATFTTIVPDGSYITATATSVRGTSEFAANVFLPIGNGDPVNIPPTGDVKITGSMVEGALLTAVHTLVDGNGRSGPVTYQWQRNGTVIGTGTTYTLTQEDVGAIITVVASYTDDDGFEEEVSSTVYGPVQNRNDAPIGSVTIDGIAEQGQTLTLEHTLDDPDGNPESYSYQWWRDGEAITGATGESYTLTQGDVGSVITVSVIYEDGYGTEEIVTSAATDPVANINDLPVGGIEIQGNLTQNETLSVDLNFTDADGVPAQLQYQWYRNGVAVENATGATYTLTQLDVGRFISVVVSYEDLLGGQETLTSAETGPIVNANDPPTGAPVINGVPRQGETLNVNLSFSDEDGLTGSFIYQWYRDGVAIAGATGQTYTLTQADVGTQVSITVFYTDAQGTDEQISSEPTGIVEDINDAPTGGLTIIGTVVEGQTLTVQNTVNDLDGNPTSFEYQWFRNGVAIPGATDDSYTLTPDDVGNTITVSTIYVDGGGTQETVTSAPTAAVASFNQAPTGNLVIAGEARQGEILTVENSLVDPDGNPESFPYQWYRNGVAIGGATGDSYTLTQADVGATITVRTTYIDGHDAQETVISAATTPVANINDDPTGGLTIRSFAEQGRTLTVQNTIADLDGLPASFSYQWLRNGVEINGATGGTYTLTEADVGSRISVTTTYVDGHGETETVTSAATALVANINDAPTGSLTISGTAQQGQTLTLQNNLHDPDGGPTSVSYQWLRNGTAISGATGEDYALTQADVGSAISVKVVYVDGHGTTETVTSAATGLVANSNDAPAGGLSIDGYPEQGRMLTAQNTIADLDGLPGSFTYQWLRDGEVIEDATGSSYILTEADVGSRISVTTTYVDGGGYTETVTSALTDEIANINDSPTGRLTVSGTAQQGQTLTLGNTLRDPDGNPNAFNYQWLRNGEAITGATGTSYVLTQADVGSVISVRTVYVDGHGTTETITSTATARVANSNDAPAGGLIIDGLAEQGQTLHVDNSIVDPDGNPASFSYQWLRNGVAISGATGESYVLTQADVGSAITVTTTYVDGLGTSETVTSGPTGPVGNINDAPTGSVVIDGELEVGSTLTATQNIEDLDGVPGPLSYQWYRDGTLIEGANAATYQLTDADVGARIHVAVSYTDDFGTQEMVASNPSAPVTAVNDAPTGSVAIAGPALQGEVLTASHSVDDADGMPAAVQWQWYRDGVAISGATSATYQLSDADVGTRIHVRLSYVDLQGFSEIVDSAPTALIAAVNAPPQGQVTITGNPVLGGNLTLTANLTDANGLSGPITYIWLRDGDPIPGATGSTYQITAADSNTTLSVLASYTDNRGFEEEVLSNLVDIPDLGAVEPEPQPEPPVREVVELPPVDKAPAPTPTTPVQEAPPRAEAPSEDSAEEQEGESAESEMPTGDLVFSGGERDNHAHRRPLFDSEGGGGVDRGGFAMFGNNPDRTLNDRMTSAVSSFAAGIEKVLYSAPGQGLFPSLQDSLALLNDVRYSGALAEAVQEIKDVRPTLTSAIVGGTAAVSTGLSVGYVVWTLRSGILMTSLLSSLPAWRFIDPLPILSGKVSAEDEDDESLESLVADTQQPEIHGGVH
jgi:Nitrous oxidase accessory protein